MLRVAARKCSLRGPALPLGFFPLTWHQTLTPGVLSASSVDAVCLPGCPPPAGSRCHVPHVLSATTQGGVRVLPFLRLGHSLSPDWVFFALCSPTWSERPGLPLQVSLRPRSGFRRRPPSVCVPDSWACLSPVPQPFPATGPSFQSNHSSESTATPARGSLGAVGSAPEPPRRYWTRRVDLRLQDQCPEAAALPHRRREGLSTFSCSSFISKLHGRVGLRAERIGLTCRAYGAPWVPETHTPAKEARRLRSTGAVPSLSSRG